MNARLLYLDSSAIVKLVVHEPETMALLALLEEWPDRASSVLARVEVLRALRRARAHDEDFQRAELLLSRLGLVGLDEQVVITAAALEPADLRTLDAIHLATALSLRAELAGLVTYDQRLAQAAGAARISVLMPR